MRLLDTVFQPCYTILETRNNTMENTYKIGDLIVLGGTSYVLECEDDVYPGLWWMTDNYGAEREFEPGMEDAHFPT